MGTAGWSLPRAAQAHFPPGASHLARYARVFPASEINSTFYRSPRTSTVARWAASVPPGFRFSIKLPRAITHDLRLRNAAAPLEAFLRDIEPLRPLMGCVLVQLPPSLAFDAAVARAFFPALRKRFERDIAVEPRHATWFEPAADRLLDRSRVARVAADPARAPGGSDPGGWRGLAYFRLHGSPRVYYSSYEDDFLDALAAKLHALRREGILAWCIFDNTTLGAGTGNALAMLERMKLDSRLRGNDEEP